MGLPRWLSAEEPTCQAGDLGSIPGLGRSPGGGNGNPLQNSCLENSMGRGDWRTTLHRATELDTAEHTRQWLLTASVLFLELSGQFTGMFYVVLVVLVVSLLTELLNQTPFYDKALEEMKEVHYHGKELHISSLELTVSPNSFVVGKSLRDIMWPHTSVIESISHADSDILEEMDDGEQRLYPNDKIIIRVGYYERKELLALLEGLVGTDFEIVIVR